MQPTCDPVPLKFSSGCFHMSACWHDLFSTQLQSLNLYLLLPTTDETQRKRWQEDWRPIVKSWLTLMHSESLDYFQLLCQHVDEPMQKNESVFNDMQYFELDAKTLSLKHLLSFSMHGGGHAKGKLDSTKELCQKLAHLMHSFPLYPYEKYQIVDLKAFSLLIILLRNFFAAICISAAHDLEPHFEYWKSIENMPMTRLSLWISYFPLSLFHHGVDYLFAQSKPQLARSRHWLRASEPQSALFLASSRAKILALRKRYRHYHTIVGRLLSDPLLVTSLSTLNTESDLLKTLDTIEDTVYGSRSPSHLGSRFSKLYSRLIAFHADSREQNELIRRPSFLLRSWLPMTVVSLGCYATFRFVLSNRSSLMSWLAEARSALHGLLVHWVRDPILEIWHTIRYSSDSKLSIIGSDSLSSDLASLERMVVTLAESNPSLMTESNYASVEELLKAVRNGNLGFVLRQYESEISSPIKNLLMGDLIRLLLIQVQKSKVDLQLAMKALDQLLKSNELNFEFLAVFPTLALLYLIWYRGGRLWHRLQGRSRSKQLESLRSRLRDAHQIVSSDTSDSSQQLKTGQLIVTGVHLYLISIEMFDQHAAPFKDWFRSDLKELMYIHASLDSKKATLERIFCTMPIFKSCEHE